MVEAAEHQCEPSVSTCLSLAKPILVLTTPMASFSSKEGRLISPLLMLDLGTWLTCEPSYNAKRWWRIEHEPNKACSFSNGNGPFSCPFSGCRWTTPWVLLQLRKMESCIRLNELIVRSHRCTFAWLLCGNGRLKKEIQEIRHTRCFRESVYPRTSCWTSASE